MGKLNITPLLIFLLVLPHISSCTTTLRTKARISNYEIDQYLNDPKPPSLRLETNDIIEVFFTSPIVFNEDNFKSVTMTIKDVRSDMINGQVFTRDAKEPFNIGISLKNIDSINVKETAIVTTVDTKLTIQVISYLLLIGILIYYQAQYGTPEEDRCCT